jgi:hypothetical protein
MKQNKIIAIVDPDPKTRERIMKRVIVELGFALIPSDAGKLIKPSVEDYNLRNAYFVIADNYKFRENPITQQRLYEMAARGIAVILGCKTLPPEYEFICEAYYE